VAFGIADVPLSQLRYAGTADFVLALSYLWLSFSKEDNLPGLRAANGTDAGLVVQMV